MTGLVMQAVVRFVALVSRLRVKAQFTAEGSESRAQGSELTLTNQNLLFVGSHYNP